VARRILLAFLMVLGLTVPTSSQMETSESIHARLLELEEKIDKLKTGSPDYEFALQLHLATLRQYEDAWRAEQEARRAKAEAWFAASMRLEHSPSYRISPGDNLLVTVSDIGSTVMVDRDGKILPASITLPPGSLMITDPYSIQAAGLTPGELRGIIADRLAGPMVSVSVIPYRKNVRP